MVVICLFEALVTISRGRSGQTGKKDIFLYIAGAILRIGSPG
ncbi:hypothetical protein [Methanolobus sp. WCC5]